MDIASIPFRNAATQTSDQLLAALRTTSVSGLTKAEAEHRRGTAGYNEVTHTHNSSRDILLRQIASPFLFLLLLAAIIAALTHEYVDAIIITLFMLTNIGLGFFQEYRAEQAVEVLMHYWREKAHVLRGGRLGWLDSRELVPGDLIRLQAGDMIPADVRFIRADRLTVDESVLTGESVSASKGAEVAAHPPKDYYEANNIGFSGTAVLTGEAEAVVIATGRDEAIGEIAELAAETKGQSTFEKQISIFSGAILKLVIVTVVFVFALNVGLKGAGNIEEILLFCIALTVGVIPEALPVVSTIAMSRGAARMAEKKVIVKRLSAIDDLGSIEILCADKTGTITQNLMQVTDVRVAAVTNAPNAETAVRLALLGSSFLGEREKQSNNAFDTALWKHASAEVRKECRTVAKIAEQPFDPVTRRNAVLVQQTDGRRTLIVRGAPDAMMALCDETSVGDRQALEKYLVQQGLAGNRVLAIAVRDNLPPNAGIEELMDDLQFAGVIAFHDPLKHDAVATVKRAKSLGVQIKILTGDSNEVAGAVAYKLGLIDNPLDVISGHDFDALPMGERGRVAREKHVFARMNPTQKFAVLEVLGESYSVGFLGEGFNDAPGLKIANVGLAVEGASDIAKEASDVVLLDPGLGVIFDGIEEGRRTYANTIKYLRITLAGNFGNFYAVAVASLFIPFLPMKPVQILLVNLLTDVPMIAIAADAVDAAELKNPKKYDAKQIMIGATLLGLVSSAFDFATFALFRGTGERGLQTMWFIVSILTELALVFSLRTSMRFWKAPMPPKGIVALAAWAAFLAVAIPFSGIGDEIFGFTRPTPVQFAVGMAVVVAYFATTEAVKLLMARRTGRVGL